MIDNIDENVSLGEMSTESFDGDVNEEALQGINFDDILEDNAGQQSNAEGIDNTSMMMTDDEQDLTTHPIDIGQNDILPEGNFDQTETVSVGEEDAFGMVQNQPLDYDAPADMISATSTSPNLAYLKSYDGSASDKMYSIDKNFSSDNFTGSAEISTIHINVGYDTYGWNIAFANGINMSLHDVREYQIRQGCLPFSSGTITYKNNVLNFQDIKRIVIYESVKYFAYGA